MKPFSRAPEEMSKNYEISQTNYGIADVENTGEERAVRATAFVTARMAAEYIPDPTLLRQNFYKTSMEKLFPNESVPNMGAPCFIELRYKSSENLIQKMLERYGEIQVIELASGFTAHGLSMTYDHEGVKKWIDNDFEASLRVKQETVNEIVAGAPIEFIPGSALDETTWQKFNQRIIPGVPVVIFCEGLMMYFNAEERRRFFNLVKNFLNDKDGVFFHEDILKYQKDNEEIMHGRSSGDFANITRQMIERSEKQHEEAMRELYGQDEIEREYAGYGFKVERISENELASLSLDKYPEEVSVKMTSEEHIIHPRQDGEDLIKADFKMWVLSNAK